MAESWWRISPADEKAARALLYRLGPERFADRVLLAWARSPVTAYDPAWRALAGLFERWTVPVFPLKAADFMKRGVPQGPALGAALHEAEEAWIAADFPADKNAVAAIAAAAAAEVRPM
jgi:poly(A) polymerase